MMNLKPEVVAQLERVLASLEQLLPVAVGPIDWQSCHAANWRRHSFSGYLEAVEQVSDTRLDDLLGIDKQKALVVENTRQFLQGFPANKKEDLIHLPDIFAAIKGQPYKFILLCDDLSFEQGELTYKMLKSALDGSVYAAPQNVLIYVTSNRRYLLPEYPSDNLGSKLVNNEVHHGEGVEEKISLSDRFGLWVAFNVFSQNHYLQVVEQCVAKLCREQGVACCWSDEAGRAAIQWSHDKSKRCGRTALQFAKHWVGRNLLQD
ncbi:MAG: ATP-binding protein [Desulfuromonadaceae bacterium]